MLKVGVYTAQNDRLGEAIIAGARKTGWQVKTRSANDFRSGDTEDFDIGVVYCMRTRASDTILANYRRRLPRVPVFVIDYGFLRRACQEQFGGGEGYWQMALDGLNALPPFDCPDDRFAKLDLSIKEKGGDPDGVVLICGQHVGDPSHGRMDAQALSKWADEQITYYEQQGRKVIFRPHPFSPDVLPSVAHKSAPASKYPLDKVFSKTSLVVCQNSNTGNEALLAGIPVVATRDDAMYRELCGEELPSVQERRDYFSRVAYAQWTLNELADGEWHRWYETNLPGFGATLTPTVNAPAVIPGSFESSFSKVMTP